MILDVLRLIKNHTVEEAFLTQKRADLRQVILIDLQPIFFRLPDVLIPLLDFGHDQSVASQYNIVIAELIVILLSRMLYEYFELVVW